MPRICERKEKPMKYSKLLSKFLSLLLLTLSLSTACSPQESPSEPSVPVQTSASEPETSESPAPTSASVSPESSAEISEAPDYSAPANWAYLESEEDERKPADVFSSVPPFTAALRTPAIWLFPIRIQRKALWVPSICKKESTMTKAASSPPTTAKLA